MVNVVNVEQLQNALTSVKVLRSSVGQVFESLANGLRSDHGEENKEAKYLCELQDLLTTVNINLRDVETLVNSLTPPPGPFTLGNTQYLGQETTQERQSLYGIIVHGHKWTDKVHEYSNIAHAILNQNSLKRSYTNLGRAKRGRIQLSSHNLPPQQVDSIIASLDRQFPNMSLSITRPSTSNVVLHITLGQVLKGALAFKGLMIEWVVIKGYNETVDLWSESRHKVFRKVTENAHAAMLHLYSPNLPDFALRSFITWLNSYSNLFSESCKRCGLHLNNALPPTWRDFRSLEPFHQECKP